MKFLVDAQLPLRLTVFLNQAGHDAVHTSDLPNGNASTDAEIIEIADAHDRVVVTKDRDFRDGHLLKGSPRKLLIVATGNLSNHALWRRCSSAGLRYADAHHHRPRPSSTRDRSAASGR